MNYNVGDKVRVKSLEWYINNYDVYGKIIMGTHMFTASMAKHCGSIVTIDYVCNDSYQIKEDDELNGWTDDMFEGLVEEKTAQLLIRGIIFPNEKYADKVELCLGNDYEVVVEDGRTFVQRKKPKYPTTYEECRKVLGIDEEMTVQGGWYKHSFIRDFYKLLICRDAYWKIAGNWKPDYDNIRQEKWGTTKNFALPFPNKEILDTFNENFKDLIEKCENNYERSDV